MKKLTSKEECKHCNPPDSGTLMAYECRCGKFKLVKNPTFTFKAGLDYAYVKAESQESYLAFEELLKLKYKKKNNETL